MRVHLSGNRSASHFTICAIKKYLPTLLGESRTKLGVRGWDFYNQIRTSTPTRRYSCFFGIAFYCFL